MAGALLDTTVLIDLLRGRPGTVRRLSELRREGTVPWTCAVNIEEVARGLRDDEVERARRLVGGLRLAPLGRDEGLEAGAWRRRFAARGVTLSQADCLIAAAARGVDATLVTGNPRHFPMQGVHVEHWPAGD